MTVAAREALTLLVMAAKAALAVLAHAALGLRLAEEKLLAARSINDEETGQKDYSSVVKALYDSRSGLADAALCVKASELLARLTASARWISDISRIVVLLCHCCLQ